MTIDHLQRFHESRPFLPFRVHLADGRKVDVRRPEFLARSPGGRTFSIATSDHAFEIFDLLLVVSLKAMDEKTARAQRRRRNGHG